MEFNELLSTINPEIYQRLKQAVELGKWQNGIKLTQQQSDLLLQVTLAYAARENLTTDELFSINQHGELVDARAQKAAHRKRKYTQNEIKRLKC